MVNISLTIQKIWTKKKKIEKLDFIQRTLTLWRSPLRKLDQPYIMKKISARHLFHKGLASRT